jgi:hypothetical protein
MSLRAWLLGVTVLLPVTIAAIGAGCGSTITVLAPADDEGAGGTGGFLFVTGGGGTTPDGGGAHDALPDYEDPGCPNQPPPIQDFQCDPYNQFNGDCLSGEACYIYVQYPSQPCGQEIYGSFCYLAGSGQQGDSCNGGLDCAAGHVCVITGSGTQCVKLCKLQGVSGCDPGFVCEAIDVEGFGGCL